MPFPENRLTVRDMADPSRELSDHPRAVAGRELRELIRCPPLRADDAEKVLIALAGGLGITTIGSIPGLPAYWVINLWRREHPEFDELCVAASEAGADALAWENVEIADDDARSPANKALSIAVRERLSKVLHRKKYDPATRVEVAGIVREADDLSNAELAAIARRACRGGAIDAVFVGATLPASDGVGDGSEV